MDLTEKTLLAALDQGGVFALVDPYGNYIYVNKKWELDTGIPAEQAIGKMWRICFPAQAPCWRFGQAV